MLGERILRARRRCGRSRTLVRASHERWDGGGYPDGLRGEEIPLGARIIAVCDTYEAMTTDRCYRTGRSNAVARSELERYAGGQFDPAVVAAFLDELETPTIAGWSLDPGVEDERAQLVAEIADRVREMVQSTQIGVR